MKFNISKLPFIRELKYDFSATVSGELFNFKIRYNVRAGKYMLSIFDTNMEPIQTGIALLPDRVFPVDRISPDGVFFVREDIISIDEDGEGDQRFLADRCSLLFVEIERDIK